MIRTLRAWRSLSMTSRIGIVIVGMLCLVAILAPWLAPYDPAERVTTPFSAPTFAHPLGADDVGHDLLSVLILGARPSLLVGLIGAVAGTVIGVIVGVVAGYARGIVDTVLMRIVDVVLALPVVPLTLVIGVLIGPGLLTQIAVITVALWAPMARELRAQVLSVRERDHIHAVRAMGARGGYVLTRHIVPAVAPLVVPQLVMSVKTAVLLEASLAFLGLGDVTSMSWGMMLSIANQRSAFLTDAWLWWVVPPGALIGLTVLGFALAGGAVERAAGEAETAPVKPSLLLPRRRAASAATLPVSGVLPGNELLVVDGLTVRYGEGPAAGGCTEVGLSIPRGQMLGLVGESGSGKSTVAAAVVGLMSPAARVCAGRILFGDVDLLTLDPGARRALLGTRIGLVPQEAQSALNPVHRVGDQLVEAVRAHRDVSRGVAHNRACELLGMVGIPADRFRAYPHELSGGQRQRVVIAIALANEPELLVADEPTSGLDVLVQQEILDLLAGLRERLELTMLVVTHDLPVVAQIADRIAVMQSGSVVEQGDADTILSDPHHPYTRRLLESLPAFEAVRGLGGRPGREVPTVDGMIAAPADPVPVLRVEGLHVAYAGVTTVRDVHLALHPGETVALVGGSGAGKSTVAKVVAGLVVPTAGAVLLDLGTAPGGSARGVVDLVTASAAVRRDARRAVHLVLQDPYASLPPHRRVRDVVAEPLLIHRAGPASSCSDRVREALTSVGLDPARYAARYPHELSGGERQRVAFARAIVTRPRVILADEPTGMLDATLRVEVSALMRDLARDHGTAILHITHDLALAARTSDRLMVMAGGEVVEQGPTVRILRDPQHETTRRLLAAAMRGARRMDAARATD